MLTAGEQLPQHPGVFVGQRDGGHIGTAFAPQAQGPLTAGVIVASRHVKHRTAAMNQQRAQVAVALFGDRQQHLLAAGGVLARHQAEIGAEGAAVGELPSIADFGN